MCPINQHLVIDESTHLIVDTFLLKVEAEDRLLLASDPKNYDDIKTGIINSDIIICNPALIPGPSQLLRY